MSSGLNVELLIWLTSQGIQNLFGALDASLLVGFVTAPQHQVGSDARADKVDPVAGPDKNTHFTEAVTGRLAIAKIVFFGAIQPSQNRHFSTNVPHSIQPCIKLWRPADYVGHRFTCSLLATPCRC